MANNLVSSNRQIEKKKRKRKGGREEGKRKEGREGGWREGGEIKRDLRGAWVA